MRCDLSNMRLGVSTLLPCAHYELKLNRYKEKTETGKKYMIKASVLLIVHFKNFLSSPVLQRIDQPAKT